MGRPTLHLFPRVEFIKLSSEDDIVNLGQGFPDFPPPAFAVEAFQHAVSGDFMLNQYTTAFVSLPTPPGAPGHKPLGGPGGGRSRPFWAQALLGVRVHGAEPRELSLTIVQCSLSVPCVPGPGTAHGLGKGRQKNNTKAENKGS